MKFNYGLFGNLKRYKQVGLPLHNFFRILTFLSLVSFINLICQARLLGNFNLTTNLNVMTPDSRLTDEHSWFIQSTESCQLQTPQ